MFNVGQCVSYGYCTELYIKAIKEDRVKLEDRAGQIIYSYTQILNNNCRLSRESSFDLTLNQGVDKMARECKAELEKGRSSQSKATLVDLRLVVLGGITGDFTGVYKTKLYNQHSGEYCQSLEIINRIRLREKAKYN